MVADTDNIGGVEFDFVSIFRDSGSKLISIIFLMIRVNKILVDIEILIWIAIINMTLGGFGIGSVLGGSKPRVVPDIEIDGGNLETGLPDSIHKAELVAATVILNHIKPNLHGFDDFGIIVFFNKDGHFI